jgi:sigma-B regulation protein RsbU (phosphoserine phosphatase)
VLTLESGKFTYANAGHNPPIWFAGTNRTMELLRRTGAALGIIEDLPMEDRTITLEINDFLLLYTDGLTEAFSPADETYGEQRLQQVLEAAQVDTARGVLDAIERSVKRFMGHHLPEDDLTMLGVKRTI